MIRYERRIKFLAAGLSAIAGFVDAVAFLELRGFFASFMSGNTTRFAVGLAGWDFLFLQSEQWLWRWERRTRCSFKTVKSTSVSPI